MALGVEHQLQMSLCFTCGACTHSLTLGNVDKNGPCLHNKKKICHVVSYCDNKKGIGEVSPLQALVWPREWVEV